MRGKVIYRIACGTCSVCMTYGLIKQTLQGEHENDFSFKYCLRHSRYAEDGSGNQIMKKGAEKSMTKNWKITSLILVLVLVLTQGVTAMAENPAETPSDSTAADAAKSAIGEAQAEADDALTESAALNEALEAYGKIKTERRKLTRLTKLKEELDGYVAAGSLTQEQADLILNYYTEQLKLQQNGTGFGKNDRMKNGNMNGFGGKSGRNGHGRFAQPQKGTHQNTVPEETVAPETSGT